MIRPLLLSAAAALAAGPALAAEADREISKQGQEGVAYAGRLRIGNDWNAGLGLRDRTQAVTTLEGAIPFTTAWTPALLHLALPLLWQPVDYAVRGGQYGMGDFEARLYALPGPQGTVSWGLGPALRLPTGTDSTIGQHKWSAGVAGGLAAAPGPWVLSIEAQQLWSLLGPSSRPEVNELQLRPVLSLYLPGNWFLVTAPLILARWKVPSGDRWTVPVGGGFGKVLSVGTQRLTLGLEAYAPLIHPGTGSWADWTVRAQVAFLFPVR